MHLLGTKKIGKKRHMSETQSKVQELLAGVASRIDTCHPEVQQRLADAMVEKEVSRRQGVLDTAVQKWEQLSSELNKVKPDQITVDSEGNETAVYTKKAHEARKKMAEKVSKLDAALDAALGEGNFKRLEDTLKKLG
jgi:hypothetical protein